MTADDIFDHVRQTPAAAGHHADLGVGQATDGAFLLDQLLRRVPVAFIDVAQHVGRFGEHDEPADVVQ